MIYTIPVTKRVEDFDARGKLTPPALLSIFENTATRHAESVGYSPMDDSLRNGMAWVITNWRAEVLRAPAYNESCTASTWLFQNPRQATREMVLQSDSGELLARGQAKLALVDRRTGKPCLPTPERLAAYQPESARTAFADRLPRLRPPTAYAAETPLTLRRSDMDYNGHLHNTAYLILALEAAPEAIQEAGVRSFRISYRSPLRLGDAPTLKSCPQSGGWTAAFLRGDDVCALVAINERLQPLPAR